MFLIFLLFSICIGYCRKWRCRLQLNITLCSIQFHELDWFSFVRSLFSFHLKVRHVLMVQSDGFYSMFVVLRRQEIQWVCSSENDPCAVISLHTTLLHSIRYIYVQVTMRRLLLGSGYFHTHGICQQFVAPF